MPSSAVSEPLKQIAVRVLKNQSLAARWTVRVPPAADGLLHVVVDQFPCARHGCCALHWRLRPNSTDLIALVHHFVSFRYSSLISIPIHPAFILDAGGTAMASLALSLLYPRATILRVEPSPSNLYAGLLNTLSLPNIVHVPLALWDNVTRLQLCEAPFTPADALWPFGRSSRQLGLFTRSKREGKGKVKGKWIEPCPAGGEGTALVGGSVSEVGTGEGSTSGDGESSSRGSSGSGSGSGSSGRASLGEEAKQLVLAGGGEGGGRAGWDVQGSTLPAIMAAFGIPRFDLVKIDIEGSVTSLLAHPPTLAVLQSAQALLVSTAPAVAAETSGAAQGNSTEGIRGGRGRRQRGDGSYRGACVGDECRRAVERAFSRRRKFRRFVDRDVTVLLHRDLFFC